MSCPGELFSLTAHDLREPIYIPHCSLKKAVTCIFHVSESFCESRILSTSLSLHHHCMEPLILPAGAGLCDASDSICPPSQHPGLPGLCPSVLESGALPCRSTWPLAQLRHVFACNLLSKRLPAVKVISFSVSEAPSSRELQ